MTDTQREMLAVRLDVAVRQMAARYGLSCMDIAHAKAGTVEYWLAHRAADRKYKALMRLTGALVDLAGGAR